jgi:hypothetical protein
MIDRGLGLHLPIFMARALTASYQEHVGQYNQSKCFKLVRDGYCPDSTKLSEVNPKRFDRLRFGIWQSLTSEMAYYKTDQSMAAWKLLCL